MVNCNAGLREAVQKGLYAQGPPTGKLIVAAAANAAAATVVLQVSSHHCNLSGDVHHSAFTCAAPA